MYIDSISCIKMFCFKLSRRLGKNMFQEMVNAIDSFLLGLGDDVGECYFPLMKLTSSHRAAVKKVREASNTLIPFFRKKIEEAKDRLESGEEASDFITCYLKEIKSINNVNSRLKEDWTLQVDHVL